MKLEFCIFKARRNIKKSSRVVGGKSISKKLAGEYHHDVPWAVALVAKGKKRRAVTCGGVLLSNLFVLTAAHCEPISNKRNRLLIGSTSKFDIYNDQKLQEISNHFIHPLHERFDARTLEIDTYDFMILKLQEVQNFCPNAFARLPDPSFDDNFLSGKRLAISGWGSVVRQTRAHVIGSFLGKIPPTQFPNHLRVLELNYLPNSICQKRYHAFFTAHYQQVIGSRGTRMRHLNFEVGPSSGLGSSMMCTSTCVAEEVRQCSHIHFFKGTCSGDSGCKFFCRYNYIIYSFELFLKSTPFYINYY